MAGIERFNVGPRMSEASRHSASGVVHLAGQCADDLTLDIGGQTAQARPASLYSASRL